MTKNSIEEFICIYGARESESMMAEWRDGGGNKKSMANILNHKWKGERNEMV